MTKTKKKPGPKPGQPKRPKVTVQYVDQQIILHRCIHFMKNGQYVDPRTIPGVVQYFGSMKELDRQCKEHGL